MRVRYLSRSLAAQWLVQRCPEPRGLIPMQDRGTHQPQSPCDTWHCAVTGCTQSQPNPPAPASKPRLSNSLVYLS